MDQNQYFVKIDGKVYGPANFERLQGLVAEGRLSRNSEISTDQRTWRRADTVSELFASLGQPLPSQQGFSRSAGEHSVGDDQVQRWHLLLPDHSSLGPISERELLEMARAGQVRPQRLVWREGFDDWRPLGETELAVRLKSSASGAGGSSPPGYDPLNRHRVPVAQPHRGALILVFGILGLLCCVLFGAAAWMMGNSDLAEMKAGQMDPSGEGLTQAGRILGIIGCLLVLGMVAFYLVILLLSFGASIP